MLRQRISLWTAVACSLLPSAALAQVVPPGQTPSAGAPEGAVPAPAAQPEAPPPATTTPQTPTVPQHTSTTAATPPTTSALPPVTAPAAPPAPPGGLARAAQAVVDAVRIYGTFKPTVTFTSAATESFSNPNESAITAAANPVLATRPGESRLSFQAAQTRFGIWVGEKSAYRAHLEFDFIDFAKASPTVQALLRLRIAAVEWSVTEQLMIAAGQDWDLHAPINPFGVNLVGAQFQSGNTGFMRQQVKAIYTFGKSLELGGAVGLEAANPTAKDNQVELARMPTFALRLTALLGKAGRIGLSGIATRLRFTPGPDERHAFAGGGALFGDVAPTATLNIRFEGYVGRNLANLGTLAVATGSRAEDVEEAGFFVSARQAFLEKFAVYGTYGHARALDGKEVVASYAYPAMPATTPPAFSAATSAGTGAGIRWNQSARVGFEYKPVKMLAVALDGYWYNTRHQLLAVDVGRISGQRRAFGGDVAMLYTF